MFKTDSSVKCTSLASIHLLIHLSTHLCHHLRLIIHHSFTLGSKPTFSTNPSHLRLLYLPDCLHDNGTGTLIVLFLVSHFNFLFIPCGRLKWLPVSFLLHVKYTHYLSIYLRLVTSVWHVPEDS